MDSPYDELAMTRAEWLEFRRSHVGGSDAAAIMGIPGAFGTAYQVWAEKSGLSEPEDVSGLPRVEWGVRLEHQVAVKFSEDHPDLVVALPDDPDRVSVLVSRERPWAMATLDGFAADADGNRAVLEIKTAHYPASRRWGESGTGARGVPPHYLAQVNHYLSVTGWDRAHVAVLIDGCDYREYVVGRDEEDVAAVEAAVDAFWHGNVEAGLPPEVAAADSAALLEVHGDADGELAEGDANQLEMVEEWREAQSRERQAKSDVAALASRLKAEIGDSSGLLFPEGRLVWERRASRRFDQKALREAEPETYERYRTETVRQQLKWKGDD